MNNYRTNNDKQKVVVPPFQGDGKKHFALSACPRLSAAEGQKSVGKLEKNYTRKYYKELLYWERKTSVLYHSEDR